MKAQVVSSCLLIVIWTALYPTEALALSALDPWNAQARDALPKPVMVWLGLMMLTNVVAIAFLKNHVASRWVFAGYAVGHVPVIFLWAQGVTVLVGHVALLHILFWTPGAIMLLRQRKEIKLPSAYGIWAIASLVFFFGSMFFDIRDGFLLLRSVMA